MANLAANGAASPAKILSLGSVLDGKYRIERLLAEGGVGVVILAHHLQLDRPVAIKLLRPEALRQRDLVEQFEREARLCAKLRSEHVVRVHDVGVDAQIGPYMVMEYLEGGDLEALLQQGPLPLETAVDYVLQACEALGEVHEHAIVHRDLKPANLFLANRPRNTPILKVIDFGISKVVPRRGANGWTSDERTAAGTPGYMAPEQLTGRAVDARVDVWALGIVLFELLTATMPFGGEAVDAICDAILGSAPARLATARPDLPPAIDAIVQRCLEKDPARRFANVGDLAVALAPFGPAASAEMTPVSMRIPRPADPRTTRPTVVVDRRRAPGMGVPIAIGLGAAVLIAGGVLLFFRGEPAKKPEVAVVTPPSAAEPVPATSAQPEPPIAATAEPPPVASAEPTPTVKPVAKPIAKPRGSDPRTGRSTLFGGGRQ